MTANYQVQYATLIFKLSDRVCETTIASRSINRENSIEALVIFKKIQFSLRSLNRYEFYSGAKK